MAAPGEVDEGVLAYLLVGTTTYFVEGETGNEFEIGGYAFEELVIL